MSSETIGDELNLTLRPNDSSDIKLRNILLGTSSAILIEFSAKGADDVRIDIDATGPEDQHELAEFLESLAEWLRETSDGDE